MVNLYFELQYHVKSNTNELILRSTLQLIKSLVSNKCSRINLLSVIIHRINPVTLT